MLFPFPIKLNENLNHWATIDHECKFVFQRKDHLELARNKEWMILERYGNGPNKDYATFCPFLLFVGNIVDEIIPNGMIFNLNLVVGCENYTTIIFPFHLISKNINQEKFL
ncbi:hypothetical protein BpHYR1_013947 [Brachionus plicatilis]|uniref:Uncharacterized protein n=1 Tax=Brachionus plicatilis TaxID=10195 RepID=A0A3M7R2T0_BRAPC|nr:hypothetical protein BpHYR1_013947 [Brachionus plicatilis]